MLGFLLDVKFRCEQRSHLAQSQIPGISFGWALSASWSCQPAALCGWAVLALPGTLNSLG